MVSSRPSQNQKRKASKTEEKTVCNLPEGDDLDTGERLPINAFLSVLPLSISFYHLPFYYLPPAHLPALRHVLFTLPQYSFENAHPVSKNLHYISEDKVEESAGFGLHDWRKVPAENSDRALSLRSVGSDDSGYSSSDAHSNSKNLAVISEDGIDETTEVGLFNATESESTSDLVNSFPFFTLGRLYSRPASSEKLPTITDFIVAVSLADFSLWAIYGAWDEDWIEAEEGDEAD